MTISLAHSAVNCPVGAHPYDLHESVIAVHLGEVLVVFPTLLLVFIKATFVVILLFHLYLSIYLKIIKSIKIIKYKSLKFKNSH